MDDADPPDVPGNVGWTGVVQLRMVGYHLAVDFGTSFTTAAVRSASGAVELLEIDNSRFLPSAVALDETGALVVGRQAVNLAAMFPE